MTLDELIKVLTDHRDGKLMPSSGMNLGDRTVFVKLIHPNGSFQIRQEISVVDHGAYFMIEARR